MANTVYDKPYGERDKERSVDNPFKIASFWAVYLLAILIYFAIVLCARYINEFIYIIAYVGVTPYAILGIVAWLKLKRVNKPVALALLLGGLTPITVVFIATAVKDLLTWM